MNDSEFEESAKVPASHRRHGQDSKSSTDSNQSTSEQGPTQPQIISSNEASVITGETLEQVGSSPPLRTSESNTGKHAFLVGSGILLSRIIGLVRQRVFAHYFGLSDAADAFNAAFRIPNLLQNVFGEGALSASFIPVYAKLLTHHDEEEASRVAVSILSILALATSVIVLIGVLTTPLLIDLVAPGFSGEKRELTIRLVRIFFPGAGLLVLSAWCLGVLNSHRRFFLSYTAPVIWNVTIIAALLGFGGRVDQFRLAEIVAWGSVVGSALQFAVQVPTVLKLLGRLKLALDPYSAEVRQVLRNFFPVFFSRGVIQISAFVDAWLASWLGTGAVGALSYTQSIYTLPVSLFGMSVSAAELPTMSSASGTSEEVAENLRTRLNQGIRRIAFLVVPSAMAFFALGDVIAAVLYQTGQFTSQDSRYIWGILAGSGVGLLAATLGRLYSSTYYALRDTRTPLLFAIVHVALAAALGYITSIHLPPLLNLESKWGAVGLTTSASFAAWIELLLLKRGLNRRIGATGLPVKVSVKLWTAAIISAGIAWGGRFALDPIHPIPMAIVVLGTYGVVYFGITTLLAIQESRLVTSRILGILGLNR